MSDTVYENIIDGASIAFTRFWRDGEDWVQLSHHDTYFVMPFKELKRAYLAVRKNVKKTKDAWWHKP